MSRTSRTVTTLARCRITTVTTAPPRAARFAPSSLDRRLYRIAAVLMVAAGVLLLVGALVPWVTYSASSSRNAFQFGPGRGLTALGPILVACGAALVVFGVFVWRHPRRPNLGMAFLPAVGGGLIVVQSWQGGFGGNGAETTALGPGSFACIAGLGLAVLASLVLLPAEHAQRG